MQNIYKIWVWVRVENELTTYTQPHPHPTFLLSYAPQVLGFILYVLPSSAYKKEFMETIRTTKALK